MGSVAERGVKNRRSCRDIVGNPIQIGKCDVFGLNLVVGGCGEDEAVLSIVVILQIEVVILGEGDHVIKGLRKGGDVPAQNGEIALIIRLVVPALGTPNPIGIKIDLSLIVIHVQR